MNTTSIDKLICFLLALGLSPNKGTAENFSLQQRLVDGVNAVDGLDNPRQIKVSPDGKLVWVTSADDNSLLILELDDKLTPLHLFKSEKGSDSKSKLELEGANGLALFNNGQSAVVASFYDSAISSFKRDSNSQFTLTEVFTDNLGYKSEFESNQSPSNRDKLGLLGAWGVSISSDEKHLFVVGYKSDAITTFNIDKQSRLTFNNKITSFELSPNILGSPVDIAYSSANNELIVAGYEGNLINVFFRNKRGKLLHRQTIKNGFNRVKLLVNPQKLVLSSDSRFMYVACSGSNAIIVFKRVGEEYTHLQSITQSQTGGTGLAGVATMTLSEDNSFLYAAGEFDKGLLQFEVDEDGRLNHKATIQTEHNEIEGVTSIAVTDSGERILVSLGKKNALFLLKKNLKSSE